MLHVLMARAVAEEHERAIQRRLLERAVREAARAAETVETAQAHPGRDGAAPGVDRAAGSCQTTPATIS
jgi:hypothetical protein